MYRISLGSFLGEIKPQADGANGLRNAKVYNLSFIFSLKLLSSDPHGSAFVVFKLSPGSGLKLGWDLNERNADSGPFFIQLNK